MAFPFTRFHFFYKQNKFLRLKTLCQFDNETKNAWLIDLTNAGTPFGATCALAATGLLVLVFLLEVILLVLLPPKKPPNGLLLTDEALLEVTGDWSFLVDPFVALPKRLSVGLLDAGVLADESFLEVADFLRDSVGLFVFVACFVVDGSFELLVDFTEPLIPKMLSVGDLLG